MFRGLIGKKLGMTGIFAHDGKYVPITVLKIGPCVVTQIKRKSTDGYRALQIGFDEKEPRKVNKPLRGHFKKSGDVCYNVVKEVRMDDSNEYQLGQILDLSIFSVGEKVDVSATTKGRGFSGVIKRHGFSGGKKTHGCKSHRIPGSIGCSAWPGKVIKGKKLPGHYGVEKKTVRNLEIIDIRLDDNIVLIRGPVPGYKFASVLMSKVKFYK